MNVARISYTNTQPFFYFWDTSLFPLISGVPRGLARAAREGDVVAGPLPIVECWEMQNEFVSLGNWGVAAEIKCRSVFVFSEKPFSKLNNITMGVTRESSTSVALCSVLIEQKYGHTVQLRRGLQPDDEAWLVIGDQALQMGYLPRFPPRWSYVTDLASEWWEWQRLPFVFAQWVVRKSLNPILRERLSKHLQFSFHRGFAALNEIAEHEAKRLQLQPGLVLEYLKGFHYQLSPEAIHSSLIFKEMVKESSIDFVPAGR